ncbi:enoyl-CoA hydratase/isomerase family protein [Brevibacterium jeotgali]|uniref:Enoyl-CoA hydratase/carnithine racemase n=1 Tax=Brevibacterium jeotgali TaxID=1262550 RepID=A0A2H1L193_9MICO|nr:enoyl-CoA hydratase/isomerase family protein [Brevibacterium jeotgali]TWC02099.1 enoyl-CoA hydratase/carnithine racemase [Brevibacterium jeotgali]SMY10550.1 Enoyl-CoA hydratase/carnithine racemase [Brevibacterium jeotgali]
MTAESSVPAIPLVDGFRFDVEDSIGTLTIDRPEKLGALSRDMWFALPEVVAAIDASPDVSVLILRGTHGNFSAGSDIGDLDVPLADFWAMNSAAEDALAESDIPTIAAIEGVCVGGGTELAAACDVRIAAPGARFGITAAKLGLVYPPGPTRRFAAAVGESWARYLLLTGNLIDTGRADSLGFLHEVDDDPFAAAQRTAERIAGRSAFTQTGLLRILRGEKLDPSGWLGDVYPVELGEGQRAFFAKEKPRFGFRRQDWQG